MRTERKWSPTRGGVILMYRTSERASCHRQVVYVSTVSLHGIGDRPTILWHRRWHTSIYKGYDDISSTLVVYMVYEQEEG